MVFDFSNMVPSHILRTLPTDREHFDENYGESAAVPFKKVSYSLQRSPSNRERCDVLLGKTQNQTVNWKKLYAYSWSNTIY